MIEDSTQALDTDSTTAYWRRLFRRWFVEYNPLYLCSAMLVLGGVSLISHEVAREHIAYGHFIVAAIAEFYSWALIGGAALLTRIGLRRPAVMLALLAVLYQCDLAFHGVTSVYLGTLGILSIAAWLGLFVGKLYALAWAVHLRFSLSTLAVPTFGALGLALIPRFFHTLDGEGLSVLVTAWIFLLFAFGLWTSRGVTSKVSLDTWGQQVLHRAARATWLLWATLALCHVLFWSAQYYFELTGLVPVAILLTTRWIRRETFLWSAVAAALLLTVVALPSFFSLSCAMAGVVFVLRALRQPSKEERTDRETLPISPYRTAPDEPSSPTWSLPTVTFALSDRREMVRLFSGAVICTYLAVWMLRWSGGPWPEHFVPLDLLLACVVVLMVWKARARLVLAPLLMTYLHMVVQRELIPAPSSTLQWGAVSVGVGFGLLIVSLAVAWWYRHPSDKANDARFVYLGDLEPGCGSEKALTGVPIGNE